MALRVEGGRELFAAMVLMLVGLEFQSVLATSIIAGAMCNVDERNDYGFEWGVRIHREGCWR
jgi:hypothetical protein